MKSIERTHRERSPPMEDSRGGTRPASFPSLASFGALRSIFARMRGRCSGDHDIDSGVRAMSSPQSERAVVDSSSAHQGRKSRFLIAHLKLHHRRGGVRPDRRCVLIDACPDRRCRLPLHVDGRMRNFWTRSISYECHAEGSGTRSSPGHRISDIKLQATQSHYLWLTRSRGLLG